MSYNVLAIDGSFLAYSRFRADAQAWRANFVDKLRSLQLHFNPMITYVAWDHPAGSSSRRALHAGYKAGRAEKEADYLEGLAQLRRDLEWETVEQVWSPEGEADDVLATIAQQPGPVVVWSADKDLLQLVRGTVALCKAGMAGVPDMLVTAEELASAQVKLQGTIVSGLDAQGWTDLLTLAGDRCDGVPGVPGVGVGRALRLLQACPAVVSMALYSDDKAQLDGAAAKVAASWPQGIKWLEKAIAHREELALSRELVRLRHVAIEEVRS